VLILFMKGMKTNSETGLYRSVYLPPSQIRNYPLNQYYRHSYKNGLLSSNANTASI